MWGYVGVGVDEEVTPSDKVMEEMGHALSTYDATLQEDEDEDLFPRDGREGHTLELGIDMLPKIAHKPMVLLKQVSELCNVCAALLPKDKHKGMFAKRTILERLMENSKASRSEDGHWSFSPIVFVKTGHRQGNFARVVSIFEQKGTKQKSWLLAKEPNSEASALRTMANYKNMSYKLDVHEVEFAQHENSLGKTLWEPLQEVKAKQAHCVYGSHVHILPGHNFYPREATETGKTAVTDPVLYLYCNIGSFLEAERQHHGGGPIRDELALLAVLQALSLLQAYAHKIFQVHLRSTGMKDAMEWLIHCENAQVAQASKTLKDAWTERRKAVTAW